MIAAARRAHATANAEANAAVVSVFMVRVGFIAALSVPRDLLGLPVLLIAS